MLLCVLQRQRVRGSRPRGTGPGPSSDEERAEESGDGRHPSEDGDDGSLLGGHRGQLSRPGQEQGERKQRHSQEVEPAF